MTRTT